MSVLKNVMSGLKGLSKENRSKAMDMLRRFRMDGFEDRLPGGRIRTAQGRESRKGGCQLKHGAVIRALYKHRLTKL